MSKFIGDPGTMDELRRSVAGKLPAQAIVPGDYVEDDCGAGDFIDSIEAVGSVLVLHNDTGDALIVDRGQLVTVVEP